MDHQTAMLLLIEHGLQGNRDGVRSIAELLLAQEEENEAPASERLVDARQLRAMLTRKRGVWGYPTGTQALKMVQDAIVISLQQQDYMTPGQLQDLFPGVRDLIADALDALIQTGTIEVRGIETEQGHYQGQPVYCLQGYPYTQVERLRDILKTVLFQLQGPDQRPETPDALRHNVANAIALLQRTLARQ